MAEGISLTLSQKKLKKHWLFITILQGFVFPYLICPLICFIRPLIEYAAGHGNFNGDELAAFCQEIGIQSIGSLIGLIILYECAYRGHGNKWLIFVVIKSLISSFGEIKNIPSPPWDGTYIFVLAGSVCLFVWWFILSVKLAELNSHLRLQNYLSSDQYNHAVASFDQAQDLQALEAKYKQAAKEAPRKHAKLLTESYEKAKFQLNMKLNLSREILTPKTTEVSS